jgi:hypothetical protein
MHLVFCTYEQASGSWQCASQLDVLGYTLVADVRKALPRHLPRSQKVGDDMVRTLFPR